MDVSNLSPESWMNIAQTMDFQPDLSSRSWQDEIAPSSKAVEDPICLFGQFVSAVSPDALKDIRPQSEFSTFVRDLCAKAPSVAQYLVREILNYSEDDSQPKVQGCEELESGTKSKRSPKRKKQPDSNYRLPKSSRAEDIPKYRAKDSYRASGVSSRVSDGSVAYQSSDDDDDDDDETTNQRSDSLVTENLLPKCEGDIPKIGPGEILPEGVQGQAATPGRIQQSSGCESALHQQKALYNSDSAKDSVYATFDKVAEDNQTTASPPLTSGAEQREAASPEIDAKAADDQAPQASALPHGTEPQGTTSPVPAPSTPVRQFGRGIQSPSSDEQTVTPDTSLFTPVSNANILSPLTEDDRTACSPDKVEMTSESLPSSPSGQQQASPCSTASAQVPQADREQSLPIQDSSNTVPPFSPEEAPVLADMVAKAVHIIYQMNRRQEVPTKVHPRILATIRGITATAAAVERPNSIWTTSSSNTWSASMWITMLEAGHARSKEVTILSMIEWMGASDWYDAELQQAEKVPALTKRGTPRIRIAPLVLDKYLKETRDTTALDSLGNLASKGNEGRPSSTDSAGIQKRILDARKKRLIKLFHRGRTLRKLIQKTHLGILFDPNIWRYAKASKENIDKIAALFLADPQKMELLSSLDEQVELLAKEGRPDLSRFFDSLESRSIILSEEVSSLRAEYGLEREPVPQGCLDTAVERVVEGIGHVLGKHTLSDDDSIMVNGVVELSCGVFNRLRSREWLNCWDIAAALEMTDRPVFMRLGLSVPLHKKDANGEVTPLPNPLRTWREEIDDDRCKGRSDLEGPQVYIRPLNVNADHFTLLEINEQTKMIYHYDSMASQRVIHRKTKSTLVRRAVEAEFKSLGFGYSEAPTPQQRDGWSCGLMVIRNAKRRMMGLLVGTWDDEVDLDRVIKEVVGDCQTFLEEGALHPSSLSKKRKKSNVPGAKSHFQKT